MWKKELISGATNEHSNAPLQIKCTQSFIKTLFLAVRTFTAAAIRTVSLYHLIKGNLHMGHFLFLFTTH